MAAKRRAKPQCLPEPRGRRGHKAVDDQPNLRAWLIARIQQTPRPTLKEIMEELRGTGFAIGRTAVWEFRVRWEKQLAERDLAVRQAQDYAALAGDEPLNVEAAISMMGNVAILNDLRKRLDESAGTVDDGIQEVLNLASRMQTSAAHRERTKNQIERGVSRAMQRIRAQMEEVLRRQPKALAIVAAAIKEAEQKELAN